jgi:hypothetical protein
VPGDASALETVVRCDLEKTSRPKLGSTPVAKNRSEYPVISTGRAGACELIGQPVSASPVPGVRGAPDRDDYRLAFLDRVEIGQVGMS